ncbi:MAG TPA: ParB/RepB/Spo0J family partition protein [Devosia sp.]|nr:ParB/RepB/Spo0J family partition protein [Devosia sp.]
MQLSHIPLEQLHVSPVNMRHGKRVPDISDILPSVRARGILQPLLVRPNADGYEIVAGRRRYFSAKTVKEEGGAIGDIPCAIMEQSDDAGALEASLIENTARLDPDAMAQYETFARLIKAGRSVASIAATFGLDPVTVRQRLALANLLPKIRDAYRNGEVDEESLQYLTMASKTQQKDWVRLFEDEDGNAPHGYYLKQWLFGGQSILTASALFPLEHYTGHIATDLFEDRSYFVDAEQFWQLQNAAIAAKAQGLRDAGWSDVVILESGAQFLTWDHEKTPKTKGGKVFVTVGLGGDVQVFEGWLSRKESRKAARAEGKAGCEDVAEKSAKPQMTQAMENYLELHRHAVVRLALLRDPGCALRLMVAHALAPSGNWNVKSDPQRARSSEIGASVAGSPAQASFEAECEAVETLLGKAERDTVGMFAHFLTLSDEDVMRIVAFVMADTLAVGDTPVEAVGQHLNPNASEVWQVDETFFELVRDRTTVNAMLAEVAGKSVAKANVDEKVKTQKKIIRDCLAGENWRSKVEGWLPGWMQFPFKPYGKGASNIADAAKQAAKVLPAG